MKRKNSKKSGIIAAVVGLSAVSLVSVGFASWVMSGGDTTTIEGNIEVESLDDQRFLILKEGQDAPKITYGDENGHDVKGNTATSIVYGIDDSTPISDAWLTAGGTGDNAPKYENLKATLTFYVANAPTASNISVTFAPKAGTTATNWATARDTKHYVVDPTIGTPSISDGGTKTIQGINGSCKKVDVDIEFGWGSAFIPENETDPVNPYVYYNGLDYDLTTSGNAKTVLNELDTLLTGMKYVLTITTSA